MTQMTQNNIKWLNVFEVLAIGRIVAGLFYFADFPIQYQLFEVSVWYVLGVVFFLLTRRRFFSFSLAAALCFTLSLVSMTKENYVGQKLRPDDLLILIQEPWFLFGFVPPLAWLCVALVLALLAFIYSTGKKSSLSKWGWLGVALACFQFWYILKDEGNFWRLNNGGGKRNISFFMGHLAYKKELDIENCQKNSPPGYCGKTAGLLPPLTSAPQELPHIVIVLLESTFDVASLKMAGLSRPVWEDFNPYPLKVYVKGGATWVQEYALLHGVAPPKYGRHYGIISYIGPGFVDGKIAPMLKGVGYETKAVYPYGEDFYNSRGMHLALGIDQDISCTDMDSCGTSNPRKEDAVVFDKIATVLDESTKPQFIFGLTMDNHSPHPWAGGDSGTEINCGQMQGSQACDTIKEYYRREMLIKQKIIHFLDRIQKSQNRRTLVVFFGDHIPGDVANFVPASEFAPGKDHETLFFMYDTKVKNFVDPLVGSADCRKKFVYKSEDIDAIALSYLGYASPYLDSKVAQITSDMKSLCPH